MRENRRIAFKKWILTFVFLLEHLHTHNVVNKLDNNNNFQLLNSADTILYSSALYIEIITPFISTHYPSTMGMLLSDVHPSEMERLDKPSARARLELATARS